jgi:hypothetical protein
VGEVGTYPRYPGVIHDFAMGQTEFDESRMDELCTLWGIPTQPKGTHTLLFEDLTVCAYSMRNPEQLSAWIYDLYHGLCAWMGTWMQGSPFTPDDTLRNLITAWKPYRILDDGVGTALAHASFYLSRVGPGHGLPPIGVFSTDLIAYCRMPQMVLSPETPIPRLLITALVGAVDEGRFPMWMHAKWRWLIELTLMACESVPATAFDIDMEILYTLTLGELQRVAYTVPIGDERYIFVRYEEFRDGTSTFLLGHLASLMMMGVHGYSPICVELPGSYAYDLMDLTQHVASDDLPGIVLMFNKHITPIVTLVHPWLYVTCDGLGFDGPNGIRAADSVFTGIADRFRRTGLFYISAAVLFRLIELLDATLVALQALSERDELIRRVMYSHYAASDDELYGNAHIRSACRCVTSCLDAYGGSPVDSSGAGRQLIRLVQLHEGISTHPRGARRGYPLSGTRPDWAMAITCMAIRLAAHAPDDNPPPGPPVTYRPPRTDEDAADVSDITAQDDW